MEQDQADARLGQQNHGTDPPEAREVLIPPDRLATQVRSDTLKRMYVTRGLDNKFGPTPGCPGCATIGSHHQASHSDTCRDRMRAELEKSEEGREYLARGQARGDARNLIVDRTSTHKTHLCSTVCSQARTAQQVRLAQEWHFHLCAPK